MLLKIFFYLTLTLSFFSCNHKKSTKNSKNSLILNDSIVPPPKIDSSKLIIQKIQPEALYVKLGKQVKIEILTIQKWLDSSSQYIKLTKKQCELWTLNKEEILSILFLSKEIDGHEFHYCFSVFPCYFVGEMRINGKIATYSINAGAYSTITFRDSSVWLGYKHKNYKKYFIEGRACPSD